MSDDEDFHYTAEELECLKDRKWWCFLLSSIFTFLAGLLIVLLCVATLLNVTVVRASAD